MNSITLNLLTERRNGETRLNKSDWTMGHIKYLWDISRGVKRLIPKNRIAGRFCKYSKILWTVGFAFMFWKSTHQRWPAWFSRNSFIKGIASRITTESFILLFLILTCGKNIDSSFRFSSQARNSRSNTMSSSSLLYPGSSQKLVFQFLFHQNQIHKRCSYHPLGLWLDFRQQDTDIWWLNF